MPPHLSAVVPIYNEAGNIDTLHRRLDAALRSLGRPYEIVYVDDGSRDGSLERLLERRRADPEHVVVVELYRNDGQFRAILAGFEQARGEVVVTLDADLQNPPEEIPRLVRHLEEGGFDVVNGWRKERHDTPFRRLASRIANRIAAALTGVRMRDYGCMLRAYRRELVRQLVACHEQSPYVPTLANALAGRAAEIEVAHAPRHSGRSHYSLLKLIGLQYDMVTSFSVLPLRWLSLLGACICVGALASGLALLAAPGVKFGVTAFLATLLFLLIGVLFLTLGFVGEYVGRIYNEVRQRPRFAVRAVHEGSVRRTIDLRDEG